MNNLFKDILILKYQILARNIDISYKCALVSKTMD